MTLSSLKHLQCPSVDCLLLIALHCLSCNPTQTPQWLLGMKNKPMIQMNSHQLQVVKSAFLSESFTQHPSQYCTSPTKSNLNKPYSKTLCSAVWARIKRFTATIKTTLNEHFTCELWLFRETCYAHSTAFRKKIYIYTKFEGETVRGANRKTLTREMWTCLQNWVNAELSRVVQWPTYVLRHPE